MVFTDEKTDSYKIKGTVDSVLLFDIYAVLIVVDHFN